jgi:hypothetical protein
LKKKEQVFMLPENNDNYKSNLNIPTAPIRWKSKGGCNENFGEN